MNRNPHLQVQGALLGALVAHAEVLHILHRDVRHAAKLHHALKCPGRMLVNDSHHQLLPAAAIAGKGAGATAGGCRPVG